MRYPIPIRGSFKTRLLHTAFLVASLSMTSLFMTSLFMTSAAHAYDGKFPPELTISDDGETPTLTITGEAERVFLLFKIYGIAHYAEVAGRPPLSLDTVVADGRGKAILIRFNRKLSLERIRGEFADSLRRNAQPEWLDQAEPTIAAFISAIDRDALAGDQLVFYWLAGGRLFVEFNGERAFSAIDAVFAKLIWSIWFGDDPVCDRDGLLANAASEGDR